MLMSVVTLHYYLSKQKLIKCSMFHYYCEQIILIKLHLILECISLSRMILIWNVKWNSFLIRFLVNSYIQLINEYNINIFILLLITLYRNKLHMDVI